MCVDCVAGRHSLLGLDEWDCVYGRVDEIERRKVQSSRQVQQQQAGQIYHFAGTRIGFGLLAVSLAS